MPGSWSVSVVGGTGAPAVTDTWQDAVLFPSSVVTVMVALPSAIPVTVPLLTAAIPGLSLDQVTFLLVALSGVIIALSVAVLLTLTEIEA